MLFSNVATPTSKNAGALRMNRAVPKNIIDETFDDRMTFFNFQVFKAAAEKSQGTGTAF